MATERRSAARRAGGRRRWETSCARSSRASSGRTCATRPSASRRSRTSSWPTTCARRASSSPSSAPKDQFAKTVEALNRARGHLRSLVGKNCGLRHAPDLHFAEDHTLERGARVEELLRSIPKPPGRARRRMTAARTDPALDAAYEEVAKRLANGKRFLLTGHRNPDGDALGSALGLALALDAAGKEARVVMRDAWSSAYAKMPGNLARVSWRTPCPPTGPRAGTRSSRWSAPRRIAPAGRTSSPARS